MGRVAGGGQLRRGSVVVCSAAAVIALIAGCGGSSGGVENSDLLNSMGTKAEAALAQNAEEEFGKGVVEVKAPFGSASSCDGDGDTRTCTLTVAVGSSEGSTATEFSEGSGGAIVEFEYKYDVKIDGNCYTARSNDFEVRDSPIVAEAEGVPRQHHSNEEAPTLKDCL